MSTARRSSPAGSVRPPESGGISTSMCLLAITSSMCCSFPVLRVRQRDLRVATPARWSSPIAAAIIGSRLEKSAGVLVISAASTIWPSSTTACAL
jgi:hypothetical protein